MTLNLGLEFSDFAARSIQHWLAGKVEKDAGHKVQLPGFHGVFEEIPDVLVEIITKPASNSIQPKR
eukprot:3285817-Rhodomonas_salina.3